MGQSGSSWFYRGRRGPLPIRRKRADRPCGPGRVGRRAGQGMTPGHNQPRRPQRTTGPATPSSCPTAIAGSGAANAARLGHWLGNISSITTRCQNIYIALGTVGRGGADHLTYEELEEIAQESASQIGKLATAPSWTLPVCCAFLYLSVASTVQPLTTRSVGKLRNLGGFCAGPKSDRHRIKCEYTHISGTQAQAVRALVVAPELQLYRLRHLVE